MKNDYAVLRLALLGAMLFTRGIWTVYPTLLACIAFWAVALSWDVIGVHVSFGRWKWLWASVTVGGTLNAAVTLANNGRMPVIGSSPTTETSIWVTATDNHRLLFLCDRLAGGFSLGDALVVIGILAVCASWVVGRVFPSRQTAKAPATP